MALLRLLKGLRSPIIGPMLMERTLMLVMCRWLCPMQQLSFLSGGRPIPTVRMPPASYFVILIPVRVPRQLVHTTGYIMHGRPRDYKHKLRDPRAQEAYKKKESTQLWLRDGHGGVCMAHTGIKILWYSLMFACVRRWMRSAQAHHWCYNAGRRSRLMMWSWMPALSC